MFGWFKKKPAETPEPLDVVALAEAATRGMPMSERVRARALPQLLEGFKADIAGYDKSEQEAMIAEFSDAVMGRIAPEPKVATPAPVAEGADHFGQIEGLIAAVFATDFDGTPEQALEVAAAARDAVQSYMERGELTDPALKATAERAIAEHMAAVLR